MAFHSFLCLFVCILPILRLSYGEATAAASSAESGNSTSLPLTNSTRTIAFSSAMKIAASVSLELQQMSTIPAIPLPSNITNVPDYEIVSRLAPALPVVQANLKIPEAESMISDLIASSNMSSTGSALAGRQATLRVMIVGDSMTHGQQGDWTWRYRIWQWFQQNSISVQFVGPYGGTMPPPDPTQPEPPPLYGTTPMPTMAGTNGGYARGVDSGFLSNSNHFAVWGRAVAVDKGLIHDVLSQNPADMVLFMLGFNDMGWFYSDAGGTIDSVSEFISNARSVNPSIKIALANVPQRSFIGGREDLIENTNIYNAILPRAIAQWTTDQSPIHLVQLEENYSCQPGYDGLHPNAWGEFQIASAFSQTLHNDFGLGSGTLSVPSQGDPSLVRDLPIPPNFQVFSSPQGVTATWDPVYGAYSYDLTVSVNGGGPGFSGTTSSFNRWDSQWPLDGWTYSVSVRASAGDSIKSSYTGSQSAVAKPQLPPPPNNVKVQPTDDGFIVTWDPPTGDFTDSIVEYNIIYWDWNPNNCQFLSGAAFKSSPGVVTGLKPGTNYLIAPVVWNANGQGWPFFANNAVPGAGIPAVPGAPEVNSNDPTTVHLTWTGDSSAGGYHVWTRNVNEDGSQYHIIDNVTESTCNDEYFLFPGVWNYAFAISSFNGNEESDMGPAVVAPSPPASVTVGSPGSTCHPLPSWCPGGGQVSVPPGFSTPTTPVITGSSTTTGGGGAVPTSTTYPVSSNGHCSGSDCSNGECHGLFCAAFGCLGADCFGGLCIGPRCTVVGCIGPNCVNGVCVGSGCETVGCVGPDCNGHGGCTGFNCISIGCLGLDCDSGSGICIGPNCSEETCSGPACNNGGCTGTGCVDEGTHSGGGSGAPPDNPKPSESGCKTTTFSACNTVCTVEPSTTTCKTSCQDVKACTPTSDSATTTTISCSAGTPSSRNVWSPTDPDALAPTLGAGGNLGYTVVTGQVPITGGPGPSDVPPSTDKPSSTTRPTTTRSTTTTKSTTPPAPTTTVDLDSPDCQECMGDLGASPCPPDDNPCMYFQCLTDASCTRCGMDCQEQNPDRTIHPYDPDSKDCIECGGNLGASTCAWDDAECLINQCLWDFWCLACSIDCYTVYP